MAQGQVARPADPAASVLGYGHSKCDDPGVPVRSLSTPQSGLQAADYGSTLLHSQSEGKVMESLW